jgi:hypothetical protein
MIMPRNEEWTRMVGGPMHGEDHYEQAVSAPPEELAFTRRTNAHPYPPGERLTYVRAPELDFRGGPAMYEYVPRSPTPTTPVAATSANCNATGPNVGTGPARRADPDL